MVAAALLGISTISGNSVQDCGRGSAERMFPLNNLPFMALSASLPPATHLEFASQGIPGQTLPEISGCLAAAELAISGNSAEENGRGLAARMSLPPEFTEPRVRPLLPMFH